MEECLRKRGRPKKKYSPANVLWKLSDFADVIERYKNSLKDSLEDEDTNPKYQLIYNALSKLDTWESNLYIAYIHLDKNYENLSKILLVDKRYVKHVLFEIQKKIKQNVNNP